MIDYKHIGHQIRHYRQFRGLTQEELAFSIGSSAVYISNIERAMKKPSLEKLYAIANALNVTVDSLLSSKDDPYPTSTTLVLSTLLNSSADGSKLDIDLQNLMKFLGKTV